MVKNAREALFIACEMERRAVKMYQRAAMLFPHLAQLLSQYEKEEASHLEGFRRMGEELGGTDEKEQLLLSAYAAQVIFPGGLMQASRENAFKTPGDFWAYAAGQEANAVKTYTAFADQCADEKSRQMFLAIAREEEGHYQALTQRQEEGRA